MRLTCLRNVLKFGAIWFINDKFVGTKLRWSIFPPNFRSPLRNYWSDTKSQGGPKMVRHALSTRQVWWRSAAARRREMKNGCFCLFVTLTVCVSLDYRRAHSEGYIFAIYRSILMQFSAFQKKKRPVEFFKNIWTTSQDGATFFLELGHNSDFFLNSNDKVCAHDFDHLGEGWKKIHHSLLAQGF